MEWFSPCCCYCGRSQMVVRSACQQLDPTEPPGQAPDSSKGPLQAEGFSGRPQMSLPT